MIKYIKNISQTSFNVAGFTIAPLETKELIYLKQIKYFNNGDTIVSDLINNDQALLSLDGVATLSKDASLIIAQTIGQADESYFKNNDVRSNLINSKNTQEAVEEILSNPNLLPNGKIFQAHFSYHSKAKNRWLRMNYAVANDAIPYIIPFDCKLIAITLMNDAYADTNIEIHRMPRNNENTSLQYMWEVRDTRSAIKKVLVDDTANSFEHGDKIGIYVADKGSDLKKPHINLYFIAQSGVVDHSEQFYNNLER